MHAHALPCALKHLVDLINQVRESDAARGLNPHGTVAAELARIKVVRFAFEADQDHLTSIPVGDGIGSLKPTSAVQGASSSATFSSSSTTRRCRFRIASLTQAALYSGSSTGPIFTLSGRSLILATQLSPARRPADPGFA